MSVGATGVLASLLVVSVARSQPPPAAPQSGPVVSTKTVNPQQFNALPDNAIIEHKGVRMTKGEFVARRTKLRADALAKRRALAGQSNAKFQAYRAKFLQDQAAKINQKNAAFFNEVGKRRQVIAARMTPQRLALHREAFDLIGRARNAPPQERAQLDQRAAQILQQLGVPPPGPGGAR